MDVRNTTNIGTVKLLMLKGEAGNSIASIEKTATTAEYETYVITLTDGSTTSINVARGVGIASIEKTATVGLVDTYTITLTDDTTTTFDVINGQSYTVPQNGVIYYDGSTAPEGFEQTYAPAGQGVEIDDTTASAYKTYSSSKIESLLPPNYSINEQNTGLTWIDGSEIYSKSLYYSNYIASGDITVVDPSINTSNALLIKYEGVFYSVDNNAMKTLPDVSRVNVNMQSFVELGANGLTVISGSSQGNKQGVYLTYWYKKLP